MPEPAPPSSDWTGPRPIVTGAPVVVGAAIVGIVLLAMLASIGRKPGLPALLSQDYTAMMAGALHPEVQASDPVALSRALVTEGLPFAPRILSLEPDFALLGGRRHTLEARRGAAWFYRASSAELAIAEAFEGRIEDLGPADETRTEGPRTLRLYRKTTQTIVCWQDGPILYTFAATLPTETVVGLAKRLAAPAAAPGPR
jgi:hypothetical protein